MASPPSPPGAQRAYRAACPNCGAPVEFASAASAFAVCSYCRSNMVRDGDALRRIGTSAELFDDHSPLQLGASGKSQGSAFTLVGRLQYRYKDGTWNEWHALFDTGRSAWLSEDNGRYVLAFERPLHAAAPAAADLQAGAELTLDGQAWSVGSVTVARLLAAQGELPSAPNLERGFVVADLRNTQGEVGTLDYSDATRPAWSVGRSVGLSELAMSGLADTGEKTLGARTAQCPSCGTALEIKLASTRSIVCTQCRAVVDLAHGVGGELEHFAQRGGARTPPIPLGSVGRLTLGPKKVQLPWQVVGYVQRCEVPEEEGDDASCWDEYLLYHREVGFAFLVDSEDGWSWAVPTTGVPKKGGDQIKFEGITYRKMYSYRAKVAYVLGEFYWHVTRDELTRNTDYAGTGRHTNKKLNREQTGAGTLSESAEVIWSAGEALEADAVAKAFNVTLAKRAALGRDASPISFEGMSTGKKLLIFAAIIFFVFLVERCDNPGDDCDTLRATFGEASQEYRQCISTYRSGRTSGGSFGGFSSGGGHK